MLKLCVLLVSVGGFCLSAEETSKTRLLTPRADSPTAMLRCGQDPEKMAVEHKMLRYYTFTGNETLTQMQYCVEGRHALIDDRHTYQVPAGTIGWLSDDGQQVVLVECANMAHCAGCPPVDPSPPPTPAPMPEAEVVLPPAQPPVELNELPPAYWPETRHFVQVVLVWDKGKKFPIPCWPREKGWYGTGLPIAECIGIGLGIGLPFIGGHAATAVAVGSKVVPPGGVISPSWIGLLGM